MATVKSGSSSMYAPSTGTIRLDWEISGQTGMYSTISYKVTAVSWSSSYSSGDGGSGWGISMTFGMRDYIDPNNYKTLWSIDGWSRGEYYAGQVLRTGSFQVLRDTITNQGNFGITTFVNSGYIVDSKGNETWVTGQNQKEVKYTIGTMTAYGAGAQITAVTEFDDENPPTITYAYDRGTSVDSVEITAAISFDGTTDNIPYRPISATESSYTFNFTQPEKETLYTLLRSGYTASVRFLIKTVETTTDGEVLQILNNFPKTFIFKDYKPLLRPEVWDINPDTFSVTHNSSVLVKHMSNVAYNMNVELRKGGLDVIGCYVSNGGKIVEGFTEGTYGAPTSNIFYFSATDDRGHTGTADISLSIFDGEFIDYIKLTNSVKCSPISGEGKLTITLSGKYFSAQFGPDGEVNKMVMSYKVYQNGGTAEWSSYTEITPEMTDNTTYSYSFDVTGLDYTKQHIVEVRVADLLMEVTSTASALAKPVFYWNGEEFNFNVPVNIMGFAISPQEFASMERVEEEASVEGYYMDANGSYSKGSYTWHYRKWSSGLVECWCTVPITAAVSTTWGGLKVGGTLYKTDLAYPVQLTETPLIMTSLGAGSTMGILIADSSYAADTISTGRYNIASPIASTGGTFRINYYVRGKWK